MKEVICLFGLACLLVAIAGPLVTEAMYENVCRLFKNGTKLRDPYSCQGYIICVDSTEVKYQCPDGQLYSIEKGKCIASDDSCENPCAPDRDGMWAADPKSCKGFYYCRNGASLFGTCPNDLHFEEDLQSCVHAWESTCEHDEYCHIAANNTKFKKPDSCTDYYICINGVLTIDKCKSPKAFNKETGTCVEEKTVVGCENFCSGAKNKFVSDYKTCRGYYYCADKGNATDLNPVWGQCPSGTLFDSSTQSCGEPVNIKCKYDRCDGRGDIFVNSEKDCMHYLTCKDGVTIRERMCGGYTFFDERHQICTTEVITYKVCT